MMHKIYSILNGFKLFNFLTVGEEDYKDICSLTSMVDSRRNPYGMGWEYGTHSGGGFGYEHGGKEDREIEINSLLYIEDVNA